MKRIVVFLLSFLLLVFVSISVSGNNAFAKSEKCNTPPTYSLEVANLICSLSTTNSAPFAVVAFSKSANVPATLIVTPGEECAQALADLLSAGLKIKDVQSVAPNVVYSLISPVYGQQ